MTANSPRNRWPRDQGLAFITLLLRLRILTKRWRRSANWAAKLSAIRESCRSNSARRAAQLPKSFPRRATKNPIKSSKNLLDQSVEPVCTIFSGGNHGDHRKNCPVRGRDSVRKDPVESDRDGEARAAGLPWR